MKTWQQCQLTPFFCKANVIAVSLIGEQGPVENTNIKYKSQEQTAREANT